MCSTFSNVGTLLGRNGGVYVALRAARPLTVEEVAGHTTGPVPSRGHNLELASAREGAGKVGVARHRSTNFLPSFSATSSAARKDRLSPAILIGKPKPSQPLKPMDIIATRCFGGAFSLYQLAH